MNKKFSGKKPSKYNSNCRTNNKNNTMNYNILFFKIKN